MSSDTLVEIGIGAPGSVAEERGTLNSDTLVEDRYRERLVPRVAPQERPRIINGVGRIPASSQHLTPGSHRNCKWSPSSSCTPKVRADNQERNSAYGCDLFTTMGQTHFHAEGPATTTAQREKHNHGSDALFIVRCVFENTGAGFRVYANALRSQKYRRAYEVKFGDQWKRYGGSHPTQERNRQLRPSVVASATRRVSQAEAGPSVVSSRPRLNASYVPASRCFHNRTRCPFKERGAVFDRVRFQRPHRAASHQTLD